jgi:phosphinothricin acetyltransferase
MSGPDDGSLRVPDDSGAPSTGVAHSGPLVRDATAADIAAVRAIYAHHVATGTASFEEVPPTLAEMRGRYDAVLGRGLPYLVADYAGDVAGYAYAAPFRPRSAYRYTVENSIYVHPQATGRGLGLALMDALIRRCRDLGYRQMVAVIGDSANRASIALHQRFGFVEAGRLQAAGYKFGRWLDVIFMQLALTDEAHRSGPA